MAKILSFFCLFLFGIVFVSATEWCNLPSCNGNPHTMCTYLDLPHNFEAGQNIAGQSASDGWSISPTDMVKFWTDEVQNYNPDEVSNYRFSPNTGHYTQVVWGKTTHVGCGIARYFKDSWYSTELVCNYGPPGNFLGQPVYQNV